MNNVILVVIASFFFVEIFGMEPVMKHILADGTVTYISQKYEVTKWPSGEYSGLEQRPYGEFSMHKGHCEKLFNILQELHEKQPTFMHNDENVEN